MVSSLYKLTLVAPPQETVGTAVELSRTPLGNLLRSVGSYVFQRDSVERYKKKIVSGANARAKRVERAIHAFKNRRRLATSLRNGNRVALLDYLGPMLSATIVFTALGIFGFVVSYAPISNPGARGIEMEWIRWLLLGFPLGCFLEYEWRDVFTATRWYLWPSRETRSQQQLKEFGRNAPRLRWSESLLERQNLAQPPETVHSVIRKLCELRSDTKFVVHYTEVTEIPSIEDEQSMNRRISEELGPFIVEARLGEESYYIAAWDKAGVRTAASETPPA